MSQRFVLASALLLLTPACGGFKRFVAPTAAPAPVPRVPTAPASVRIVVELERAEIDGWHHEGLAQFPQPWVWGLSDAERARLVGNVPQVLEQAVVQELASFGFEPTRGSAPAAATADADTTAVHIVVSSVEVNTFGPGFFGFLGSAGDYWEAILSIREIRVGETKPPLPEDARELYAKAEPCPAQIDYSLLGFAVDMTKFVALGDATANPVFKFLTGADYELDLTAPSPLLMAARLLAANVALLLNQQAGRLADVAPVSPGELYSFSAPTNASAHPTKTAVTLTAPTANHGTTR